MNQGPMHPETRTVDEYRTNFRFHQSVDEYRTSCPLIVRLSITQSEYMDEFKRTTIRPAGRG